MSDNEKGWPPRPVNEVFPDLLDTTLVVQLLLYDRDCTPEQGRRNVRELVKHADLPTLGRRIGSRLMFRKDAVMSWIAGAGSAVADACE